MQRTLTLISLIVLSLFIMSANKFTCQPNADLIAQIDSGDDSFSNTSIDFHTIDGSNKLIRTTTL